MGWSLCLSACDDREWWGGEDRGLLRCWGLSCLSVAWLITEANSKRIAGGNKDTSMSAVSSSEGPIRQMDAYWQARDGKERAGERWREGWGGGRTEEVSPSRSPWHGLQCQPTRWPSLSSPCPGYYLKPNKYLGVNVTTRTPGASSPPISVRGFKSPFLLPPPTNPSSSFLHPASHPHSTPDYRTEGR